ncbi:MAG TPA: POTRA domain-containing protein, partial [Bacteroidia bacterium]|nr:POTRA domain-containing protein [Bacteroidia bacterium]
MQPRRIRRPLLSTVLLIISLIANFSAFADEPGLVVLDVTLIGNRHTRDHILLRELTFAKGDTLPTGELEKIFKRSEDNLFNTSLFNSTKITWLRDGDGIRVFVIVTERWYIFPVPIIEVAERNLNTWWKTKDYSRLIYGGSMPSNRRSPGVRTGSC